MAATDAKLVPTKNAAYRVTFPLLDSDGDLVTNATGLDSEVSKDGGTFADATNEAIEIATASGMYYLDLTATEMNADTVAVIVKTTTTGAKTTVLLFYPQESGDLIANATQLGGTTQTGRDIGASVLLSSGTGTGQVSLASGTVTTGAISASAITATAIASDALTAAKIAADAGVEIASAVWDRVLNSANHNIASSAGRRVRQLDASSITDGTAQAGASNSITLAAAAPATNEIYDENLIVITEGTGAGQTRVIVEYNGTTKVAIVNRAWEVTPDSTSVYEVIASAQADIAQHGLAQAGAASTITLASTASSVDNVYVGSHIYISSSTGTGQTRLITAYVGSTKVATVSPAWTTTPASTSVYKIMPAGYSIVGSVATGGITADSLDATVQARLGIVASGTAQAATSTTLQLAAASAFANDELLGAVVVITGGTTGVGQSRVITDYVASTDTATVDAWTTTPTGTITYVVFAAPPASATVLPAVNIKQINSVTLQGTGVPTTDPWEPA